MAISTIYYVDDDSDDLEYFRFALSEIDKNVLLHTHSDSTTFINGLEDVCKEHPLILLDINMPGKSGFEVLKEIRTTLECKNVPVVMISTSDNKTSVLISKDLGADMYIIKPNDIEGLKTVISKLLKREWKKVVLKDEDFLVNSI